MTISTISDNMLDAALGQLQAGETITRVLGSYPGYADSLGPLLEATSALKALDPVEVPAYQAMTHDRNDFLAGVTTLQLQPVSISPLARLKEWTIINIPWLFPRSGGPRTEVRQMSLLFLKAALIFTIALGSVGGAMVAAEDSLPGSPVYSFKLARENVRLALNSDPAEEAALHLNMAEERVQEMIQTSAKGDVPQEATLTRLQTHMNEAFRNMAQTADEPMVALLLQSQEMTRHQEQALTQAQEMADEEAQTQLKETARQMSQWHLEAEEGLQDPDQFRLRHGNNRPEDAPGPGGPGDNSECAGDCDPIGDGNQYGQDAEVPPAGPGPGGPGGNPECTGDCEPNGDGNQYGQDTEEPPPGPGPGGPGGNPDCSGDCDPIGDGNRYGQDAEEPPAGPGPGQLGGNPECTGDCDPIGDGNQYGQDSEEPPPGPGPGEPEGNPECTGDCEPAGDGNQSGQDSEEPPPGPGPGEPEGNPESPDGNDQSDAGNQGNPSAGGNSTN